MGQKLIEGVELYRIWGFEVLSSATKEIRVRNT
jgi:hypothetical protein